MRLVLLWFGLWKNGESIYIPNWVKLNQERFFWGRGSHCQAVFTISPFWEEAVSADVHAFTRLMRHIRETD